MKKTLLIFSSLLLLFIGLFFHLDTQGQNNPRIQEFFLTSPHVPISMNGIRIVQLSDLHISYTINYKLLENTVESINRLNPDIVVFSGNLFAPTGIHQQGRVSSFLSSINANLAKIAVLGYIDQTSNEH